MDDTVRLLGQRNYTALLSALAERTGVRTAEAMGVSESVISELKKPAERICYLLAAVGLKVNSASMRSYDPEYLKALKVLAREGIERDDPPSGFGEL